jgi:hypothetical protein
VAPDTRYEQAAAIFKHDKNWMRSLTGRRQRREREKLQVEPPREKASVSPKGDMRTRTRPTFTEFACGNQHFEMDMPGEGAVYGKWDGGAYWLYVYIRVFLSS